MTMTIREKLIKHYKHRFDELCYDGTFDEFIDYGVEYYLENRGDHGRMKPLINCSFWLYSIMEFIDNIIDNETSSNK
jgi:hypothetical protein